MMGATAAMSAVTAANAAQSAVAQAQARQAAILVCQTTMPMFSDAAATVEQRQAYASCVRLVFPEPVSDPGEILFTKVMIVAAVGGLLMGAVRGASEHCDRIMWVITYGLLAMLMGPLAVLIGCGVWVGIKYMAAT